MKMSPESRVDLSTITQTHDETESTQSPQAPARSSLTAVRRFTWMTLATPMAVVAVVFAVGFLRLQTERAQAARAEARLASTWLADRLQHAEPEVDAVISGIVSNSKLLVAVFQADGSPVAAGSLAGLDRARARYLIEAGESTTEIHGKKVAISSQTFLKENKAHYAVVGQEIALVTKDLVQFWGPWAATALVSILVSMLFGTYFGRDLNTYFAHLRARLLTMAEEKHPQRMKRPGAHRTDEYGTLASAVRELENRFRGELAMYQDALEEVDVLSQKRTDFLRDVACELQVPLKEIVKLTEQLLSGQAGPLEENQREDLQIISTATDRLENMVNDIMDLSSLIDKGLAPGDEVVDLREVLSEVIDTARGAIGDKKIEIVLQCDVTDGPHVKGDRQRLWQVFTNLLSNALKFTEEGLVHIEVSSEEDKGEASVRVRDTGVGIPEEHWESIFNPFHQQGPSAKKLKGTGLGLAISKRIVELYRGSISVSAEEGKGSTFTVRFPYVKTR